VKLGEHLRSVLPWNVDDRVAREDATERTIRDAELDHRPHGEPQLRISTTSERHHLRRQVDAERVQAEPHQLLRHQSRPAADVGNGATTPSPDELNTPSNARSSGGLPIRSSETIDQRPTGVSRRTLST
jgi:hypothetical protein